ncbi:MAG TPA: IscS subfamily cysteine desulfurase [Thermoanaerobaculia bacterium]|nr:IscS subfamily cysteine desulfurase [Thermoanaerobaculia bacterium]
MPPKLPIYLDCQATTPVDPRVLEAMLPWFTQHFGNAASRSHVFGWRAEAAVTEARERLAEAIGATPKEIVFTSGATESDDLALFGACRANRAHGNHVITSMAEHNAVLDPCRQLEKEGFEVTYLRPDRAGRTSAESVAEALTERTILVSIMAANNEIGTLNPVGEIGALCKSKGILLHTDAAQAFGKEPLDVHALGVDLMSLSAHKLYGPKGVGCLYVRATNPRVRLTPILYGGGHERGLRSGTLDVPGIVGFGAAARLALAEREEEQTRIRALRDRLWDGIRTRLPEVSLNGPPPAGRLAGNLNVSFAFVESDALMTSMKQIAVSSGSACTSASLEPSHVLRAIGVPDELAHASIRFGLGRFTTSEEVDYTIETLADVVPKLRAASPRWELARSGISGA